MEQYGYSRMNAMMMIKRMRCSNGGIVEMMTMMMMMIKRIVEQIVDGAVCIFCEFR